jgi:hypothetical protein
LGDADTFPLQTLRKPVKAFGGGFDLLFSSVKILPHIVDEAFGEFFHTVTIEGFLLV